MTRGMRKLIGGIALLGCALVLLGYLTGAEWLRLVLGLFGAAA